MAVSTYTIILSNPPSGNGIFNYDNPAFAGYFTVDPSGNILSLIDDQGHSYTFSYPSTFFSSSDFQIYMNASNIPGNYYFVQSQSASYLNFGYYNGNQFVDTGDNIILDPSLFVFTFIPSVLTCFKHDSKILTDRGYLPIQDLKKGDLVKTLKHDFKAIHSIGVAEMDHVVSVERIKDQLYRCSPEQYPELIEDLVITGCHSLLVDRFQDEDEKSKTRKVNNGELYVTDGKYRLPACVAQRSTVFEIPGHYQIYHLALENDDYYMNYGIYANGLLVETCSQRYLKELSNMTLMD